MKLKFSKMTGSGNDFILIDNMDLALRAADIAPLIPKICARRVSVGADGFIIIEPADGADFMWHFYNADGSEAEMCGNGARCAARFAWMNGYAGRTLSFITKAGLIRAEITGENAVKIRMTEPSDVVLDKPAGLAEGWTAYSFVNTGVPHVVLFSDDADAVDVNTLGRTLRNHKEFAPAGANVNFVTIKDNDTLRVRTYERGVEAETLACGTGAVASALIAVRKGTAASPVTVKTSGGIDLTVYLEDGGVFLEGEARLLCSGTLFEECMYY